MPSLWYTFYYSEIGNYNNGESVQACGMGIMGAITHKLIYSSGRYIFSNKASK